MSQIDKDTKELCQYFWKTRTRKDVLGELIYVGYEREINKGLCLNLLFQMLVQTIIRYRRDLDNSTYSSRLASIDDKLILEALARKLYDSFRNG